MSMDFVRSEKLEVRRWLALLRFGRSGRRTAFLSGEVMKWWSVLRCFAW
jgi:hypothetical protein